MQTQMHMHVVRHTRAEHLGPADEALPGDRAFARRALHVRRVAAVPVARARLDRCARRHAQLPARRVRLPHHSGLRLTRCASLRPPLPSAPAPAPSDSGSLQLSLRLKRQLPFLWCRQLGPLGSGRGAQVGARQHRVVQRRQDQCHQCARPVMLKSTLTFYWNTVHSLCI